MGVSISIDGDEETHDRLRGVAGSYRAAFGAMRSMRARKMRVACNTQINRLSMPHPRSDPRTDRRGWAPRAGRSSSRSRWGAPPTSRTCSFSPTICSSSSPSWRAEASGATSSACASGRATTSATSARSSRCSAGTAPAATAAPCGAGRATLGIEANGAIKGCPSLPTTHGRAEHSRRHARGYLGAQRAAPLHARSDRRATSGASAQTCYYAEECMSGCTWTSFVTLGRAGNNPYRHHRALEMQRVGKRERIVRIDRGARRAFRPRYLRARGRRNSPATGDSE